jgi:hypothetical protein
MPLLRAIGPAPNAGLQLRRAISIQAEGKRLLEKHAIAPSAARLCWAATHHESRSSLLQVAKSSTGLSNRPSNHSAHFDGPKSESWHWITQERNSRGPPFLYGGGDTGLSTVGQPLIERNVIEHVPELLNHSPRELMVDVNSKLNPPRSIRIGTFANGPDYRRDIPRKVSSTVKSSITLRSCRTVEFTRQREQPSICNARKDNESHAIAGRVE